MNYKKILYTQLAKDMHCTVEALFSKEHVFSYVDSSKARVPSRAWNNTRLCIICLAHKMVVRSDNLELLAEIKAAFDGAEYMWFSEIESLLKLQKILTGYGMTLTETSPYLIPTADFELEKAVIAYEEVTLQGNELEQFRGDMRFSEALAFQENYPDKIAVVARENGQVIAMAGASADSDAMWQIGIDVLPDYRGQNLASNLVHNIAVEVITTFGKLPYYSTAFSHITSLNTGIKAGFQFGWMEINAEFIAEK